MRQLLTPERVNFTATLQALSHNSFFLPCEVWVLFRSSLLISSRGGVPSSRKAPIPSAVPEMRGLPPRLLLFNFPSYSLVPSTSPLLSPSLVAPLPSPLLTHSGGRKEVTSSYPQSDSWRASSRSPGVRKLFTFISKLEQPRDLPSAQAHAVSSKKATAFPSPRRPREQRPICERQLKTVPSGNLREEEREAWTEIT